MKQRQAGLALLVLLAILLAVLPAAGCGGGDDGKESVLLLGVLADFTGAAGLDMEPTINAFEDYLTKVVPNSNNPFPKGLKVDFTHFDTQLDCSKTTPGYVELKSRGVKLMVVMNAQDREILADRPEQDSMPTVGTAGLRSRLDDEWMLTTWSPIQSQGEVEMTFIMGDWDYAAEGRSPKVGHLGCTLSSSAYCQEGIDRVRVEYADKFVWAGFEKGALGNMSWGSEVSRLRDCDYIIVSAAGSMLSSFVAQARDGGYTGKFITGTEGFPGSWPLVTGQVASMDQLYGCYYVASWPWWNEVDDVPLIQDCKDYIAQTYTGQEAEELLATPSVISGWELGVAMGQIIRNAIAAVGVKNLDGPALKEGIRDMDLQLEGYRDHWQVTPNSNCLQWSQRAFEYNLSKKAWEPLPTVYEPTLTRPTG